MISHHGQWPRLLSQSLSRLPRSQGCPCATFPRAERVGALREEEEDEEGPFPSGGLWPGDVLIGGTPEQGISSAHLSTRVSTAERNESNWV